MKRFLLLGICLFLVSCGTSRETKFYSIIPIEKEGVVAKKTSMKNIGVYLVSIPAYLERPQIVTFKKEGTEVYLADFNRWAEPLSNSLQRVFSENLNSSSINIQARAVTSSRISYDYYVLIEIVRLDGELGGKAYLDAWWTITDKNNKVIFSKQTRLNRDIDAEYEELVNGQSQLIHDLSLEISSKINSLK